MMRVSVFMFFLLFFKLTLHSQIALVETDSILRDGVHNLIYEFYENFGLTDSRGDFEIDKRRDFLDLFDENAEILNQFPGSQDYDNIVPIEQYLTIVESYLQDHTISLSQPLYYEIINEYYDHISGSRFLILSFINEIKVFKRSNWDLVRTKPLELEIIIESDSRKGVAQIKSVTSLKLRLIDLDFRVITSDRQSVRNLPVEIVYAAPGVEKVLRTRNTDFFGRIRLSDVPANASIRTSSLGERVLTPESINSVSDWMQLDDENRFVFLEEKKVDKEHAPTIYNSISVDFGSSLLDPRLIVFLREQGFLRKQNNGQLQRASSLRLMYLRTICLRAKYDFIAGLAFERYFTEYHSILPSLVYLDEGFSENIEDNSIAGGISSEAYKFEVTSFPFISGLRYKVNNSFINSIDLSLLIRYTLPYVSAYELELDNISIPEEGMKSEVGNPLSATYLIQEGNITTLRGYFRQNGRFSVGVETAFNFNLYNEKIFLQYKLSYIYGRFGSMQSPEYFQRNSSAERYLYQPFLTQQEISFNDLVIQLGLMVSF